MALDKWTKWYAEDNFFWTTIRERWAIGRSGREPTQELLDLLHKVYLEAYEQGYEDGHEWAGETVGDWYRPRLFGY